MTWISSLLFTCSSYCISLPKRLLVLLSWFIMQLSKKKSSAAHFQAAFPTSFSCIYWWHFDGIWRKCELHALSWLSRLHLESIKHGLKDPIEAPLIAHSLSLTHTHTHTKYSLIIWYTLSASSSNRCIPSSKSRTWWKPTSQFVLRTGARRRRRCAKGTPILWCLTNA